MGSEELAKQLFNDTWTLMAQADRSPADDDRMLHTAHASRHHWGDVGSALNLVRGEWLCSRVYAVLGRPEPALHHARRALVLAGEADAADWDLAFCHEALARAYALAGEPDAARTEIALAREVSIAEAEDRDLLAGDLATIPGGTVA